MSTRLPLQSPRFLLGAAPPPAGGQPVPVLLRACRFWRIKPLAMAAAMVAPARVRRRRHGEEPRDPGEGRETQTAARPRGGGEEGLGTGRRGAQSPLGLPSPSPRSREPSAQMPPGARGGAPRWRPRRSREWGSGLRAPPVTACGQALSPTGSRPPLLAASLSVPPPKGELAAFFRARSGGAGARKLSASVRQGAPGRIQRLTRAAPGRCRRRCPLADSAGDCQVLWKSASGESNLLPGDL